VDESYFDHIAQEILKQKQRMDQLTTENRELRQHIANLRAGWGISVEIAGNRFTLRDGLSSRDHLAETR
jgi:cell division protein FtsB